MVRFEYSIPTGRCDLTIIVKAHLPVGQLYLTLTLALSLALALSCQSGLEIGDTFICI